MTRASWLDAAHGFPHPRAGADVERERERVARDVGWVPHATKPLQRCGNCHARYRVAVNFPTLGPCCPLCLKPTGAKPTPVHNGRLRQVALPPAPKTGAAVYTDASFRTGVAGLAVTGALGEYTRRVSVRNSYRAERMALDMAMSIARGLKRRDLVFRSDCEGVVADVQAVLPDGWGWTVEQVRRRDVARAHLLAGEARRRIA